jgi:hypothetical protein
VKRRLPGRRWVVRANRRGGRERVEYRDDGVFDELHLDGWLHVEQTSASGYVVQLGPLRIDVGLRATGEIDLVVERDFPAGGKVLVGEGVDTAGASRPVPERGAWWIDDDR